MIYSRQRGQGLVELIVAISVITTGMFAVWSLALSSYTAEREAQLRFTGANLAREGVELVKNIRDSNWLAVDENELCDEENLCQWNSGLDAGSYVAVSSFSSPAAPDLEQVNNINEDQAKLYQDSAGFFSHDDGSGTLFRRLITIQVLCCADVGGNRQCDNLAPGNPSWTPKAVCAGDEQQIGIDVVSRVIWQYNSAERDSVVQTQLFNWR